MAKPDIKNERDFHDRYFNDKAPREREDKYYDRITKDIILNDIFALLPDLTNKRVLYYGCGDNISILERLSSIGAEVLLFDLSEVALGKIKKKYPDAKTTVADAHHLPYKNQQFDLIFGRGILHHLEIPSALKEVKRVLAPTGQVIFIEPLGINPIILLYRLLTPGSRTKDERPFGFREIRSIQENFTLSNCRYYFLLSVIPIVLKSALSRKNRFFEILVVKLHKIDNLILKIFPFVKYMAWIGVFRLTPK